MKLLRTLCPLVTYVLVLGACAGTAHANLFVNGSFENTPLPAGASTTTAVSVGAGTQVSGWTTTLGDGDAGKGNYFAGTAHTNDTWIPTPAQNGNYFVQLDSRPNSGTYSIGNSIYQALNLTANTQYSISFYFRSETGNTNSVLTKMTAYVGLDSQGNVPVNATGYNSIAAKTFTSPSLIDASWNLATLNFSTTTAGLYRFTFLDGASSPTVTGGTNAQTVDSNASLDNFTLDVVPEFAHWAVFAGFGLLVVGGKRLRRGSPGEANATMAA